MKKLVIVGGGFTGAYCAKKLENYFDTILIDSKDYFEFTPGILKTIINPLHIKKIQIMHSHYLKKAKIFNEYVIGITKNQVKTEKRTIQFDYLIIASGSKYNSPFKEQEIIVTNRAHHIRDYHINLIKSKKIVIIGGGIVGVEMAAEICTKYKDKKIIIIEKNNRLMSRNYKKTAIYAEKFLKNKGVEIKYNEDVIKYTKGKIKTKSGEKIKADLMFICTGITSNSNFLRLYFSKYLNERGQLNVNEYLQVNNFSKIFAGGDITAIKEEKLAQNAEKHAQIIVHNLKNIENIEKMIKYLPKKRTIIISLGKYNGILEDKNLVITGLIPGILKTIIELKTMIRYKK